MPRSLSKWYEGVEKSKQSLAKTLSRQACEVSCSLRDLCGFAPLRKQVFALPRIQSHLLRVSDIERFWQSPRSENDERFARHGSGVLSSPVQGLGSEALRCLWPSAWTAVGRPVGAQTPGKCKNSRRPFLLGTAVCSYSALTRGSGARPLIRGEEFVKAPLLTQEGRRASAGVVTRFHP